MYKEHPAFESPPNENAKIWRYMDFTKFVSLLQKEALFFPRADKLGDAFEGSYPLENVIVRKSSRQAYLDRLPEYIRQDLSLSPSNEWNKAMSAFYKKLTKFMFINSWHQGEGESAAMWKLYLKSNEGIAIQSTYNRLRNCFKKETPDIWVGRVKYMDYTKELIADVNFLAPFLSKRKSFRHEQEVRAIIFKFNLTKHGSTKPAFKDGLGVAVDPELLIEKVYVAPASPPWVRDLIKSVMMKYGLDRKPCPSELDSKPLY
ncbi:hypothetical protein ACFLUZ_00560 [Chloroflexota bacterium]